MTTLIDTGIAYRNSRSFQRLWKAIRELTDAIDNAEIVVTPSIAE